MSLNGLVVEGCDIQVTSLNSVSKNSNTKENQEIYRILFPFYEDFHDVTFNNEPLSREIYTVIKYVALNKSECNEERERFAST